MGGLLRGRKEGEGGGLDENKYMWKNDKKKTY